MSVLAWHAESECAQDAAGVPGAPAAGHPALPAPPGRRRIKCIRRASGWTMSSDYARNASQRAQWALGVRTRVSEINVLGFDRPGRPPRCRLVGPVQVRVRDNLVRRGRAPLGLVLRGVRVADQCRVIAPGEGAVEGRADAGVGLRADDYQPPDAEPGQHVLQGGVFEGVAVVLLDQRL